MGDLKAAEKLLDGKVTGADIVRALHQAGFEDVAKHVFTMLKQRLNADYLQTSAILDKEFHVMSAVNCKNDYQGPGTGLPCGRCALGRNKRYCRMH